MASTRIINYVLYKRFVAISNLKNVCILSTFNINSNFRQNAYYCTKKSIVKTDSVERENKIQVGFADVGKFRRYICENIHNVKIDATLIIIFISVKENTKSIGYLGVIIGGIGITVFMFYIIFDELFSSKSPNSVYSKALDRCIKHPKIIDALGEPIKAYGEMGRRRSHIR